MSRLRCNTFEFERPVDDEAGRGRSPEKPADGERVTADPAVSEALE